MESTATNRVWKKGPPPHVGWWNASSQRDPRVWRWWDGKLWRWPSLDSRTADSAARDSQRHSSPWNRSLVEWTDYWPEGARVPRLEGEWTFHHGDAGPMSGRIVDVVFRNGGQGSGLVESWSWDHTTPATSREFDIVAWRFA
jgi:hypothetical protein